jgi:hypothetical protein
MLQKIKSRRVELPPIYLVETLEDYKQLPKGIPYIIGNQSELKFITIFLEFQVIYKSCLKTGLPIKWLNMLKRLGYNASRIRQYDLNSGGNYDESSFGEGCKLEVDDFVEQQYLVNFDKLSELKVLPKWLDDIRDSVQVNIVDEIQFDPMAFNKQLGLNIGNSTIKHNMKNLLILDVSASIPTSIVTAITSLAKLMSKKFYADILITSSQSKLIDYEDVFNTDIVALSESWTRGNEGKMYKAIVEQPKKYNTVISFGDNDNPLGYATGIIDCKFEVETLYSLHTDKRYNVVTGYAKAFKPKTTHIVQDWVNTLN